MTKAVIFDVDGVLLDSFQANLKLFQDLMREAGYAIPTEETYATLFHLPGREVVKRLTKTDSPEELQRIHELRLHKVRFPVELLSMPEDAAMTLAALRNQYALGIVTNRIRSGIFESTELASLKECFSTVVAYEDTERHKPDPEPLLLALENLEVRPDEAVYIGDSPDDLAAARSAGTHFIYYSSDDLDGADATTSRFADLPASIVTIE